MIAKIGLSLIGLLIATIPIDLFLLMRWAFQPQGFWQNLVLTGLGVWVLGGIQILFLILLIGLLVKIWEN